MIRIHTSPQVERFNRAVDVADLLLGPEWTRASVDELVAELCRRQLWLTASELRAAALKLEEPNGVEFHTVNQTTK